MKNFRTINDDISKSIELLNRELGAVQLIEYSKPLNLANSVLSRNSYESNLLKKIILQPPLKTYSFFYLFCRLILCYWKSFSYYFLYITFFVLVKIFLPLRKRKIPLREEIVVVDNYLLLDEILLKGEYRERYFPGLYDVLNKKQIEFVLVPRFYGISVRAIRNFRKFKEILNKENSIILEFQLLKFSDLLKLLYIFLFTPVVKLKLARKYKKILNGYLSEELFESVSMVPSEYVRYLIGRRYDRLNKRKLKIISWFENQTLDKSLYRGLRECSSETFIYGCQPFIFSPSHVHLTPTSYEDTCGVLPDVILRNGTHYLENINREDFKARFGCCPSFRYQAVFEKINWENLKDSGLLMSFFDHSNKDLTDVVKKSELRSSKLYVKFHPAYRDEQKNKVKRELPDIWKICNGGIDDVLERSWIVITSESGTALEAISRGVSVIIVANKTTFTSNPLTERAKGEMWEMVYDSQELDAAVKALKAFREKSIEKCQAHAKFYQDSFFTRMNEDTICKAFDL